mmetsp:Transcript_5085/g.20425  ORF Transcript_5085/g.20425 Transcript_5085/m.20425 type:complete len:670 (-) Transcript_5085:2844-4853(-)
MRAVLGVHLPGVEQLALVALDGRQLGAVRARPRHRAVLPEPLVEHHRHLVRGRGDEHLVLPLLRERLPVALREDLLLLVQKHHVLVQERRPEHVRHPRRRRQGEQVELEPAVLPHLGTLAALAHRRDEVAAPPRFRGDAVVRRQEPRLVVSPVDLQKARRLEVVRRLGVVLADGVERRHRRIERAPEPGFSGHRPFHHAVEPGGVVVARAHERVVRHHRVRRVDCVFEKRRPPVRHVPNLPVVAERPARSRAALAHALDFGNQQRGSHRRLQLGVFPALAPRPHQALRLHGGARERARPRVRLDALLLLRRAGLGHVHALSRVVETPRVVRAKQRAVVLDASLGERREAVRALVLEHAPLAFAVFPHHQIDAQELRGVRLAGVQQVDHRDGVPLLGPVERARVGGLAARRRLHHRDAVGGDADERIRGGRVRRESAHRHHPRPRPDGGGGGARRDPRRGHVQLDQAVVPRRGDRPAGHQQAAPHAAPGRRSGGVEKRRRQVERVRGQVPAPPRAALRGTRRGRRHVALRVPRVAFRRLGKVRGHAPGQHAGGGGARQGEPSVVRVHAPHHGGAGPGVGVGRGRERRRAGGGDDSRVAGSRNRGRGQERRGSGRGVPQPLAGSGHALRVGGVFRKRNRPGARGGVAPHARGLALRRPRRVQLRGGTADDR